MTRLTMLHLTLLGVFSVSQFFTAITATSHATTVRAISESKYSKAHSLGDTYKFDPRDGWQNVNITNLPYKYRRDSSFDSSISDGSQDFDVEKRTSSEPASRKSKKIGMKFDETLRKIWKSLKGFGSPQDVIITWYTGHDLQNPSCWSNTRWAPTDASFACALTLEGWKNRPRCFQFLELCSTPKKCVFVRVVDTCAGCAKGSKHVDLTRAAFGQLADFDEGTLSVQLRLATNPSTWLEKLWGPKVN